MLALSCSTPMTLTRFDSNSNIQSLQLQANDKEDILLICDLRDAEGKAFLIAQSYKGGRWIEPYVLSREVTAYSSHVYLNSEGTGFISRQIKEGVEWAMKNPQEPWCITPYFYGEEGVRLLATLLDRKGNVFLVGAEKGYLNLSIVDPKKPCCESLFLRLPDRGYCAGAYTSHGKKDAIFAAWVTEQPISGWWSQSRQYTMEGAWHKEGRWFPCDKIHEMTLPENSKVGIIKVVLDTQNNPTIVWQQYGEDKKSQLRAMTYVKDAWVGPFDLCASKEWISDVQLEFDGKDNLLVVWHSYKDKISTVYTAYKPAGQRWMPAKEISKEWATDPVLATDERGHFVVLWRSDEQASPVYGSVYSDEFSAWSKPLQLTPDKMKYSHMAITFNEQGKGFVAFIHAAEKKELQFAEIKLK